MNAWNDGEIIGDCTVDCRSISRTRGTFGSRVRQWWQIILDGLFPPLEETRYLLPRTRYGYIDYIYTYVHIPFQKLPRFGTRLNLSPFSLLPWDGYWECCMSRWWWQCVWCDMMHRSIQLHRDICWFERPAPLSPWFCLSIIVRMFQS